MPYKNKPRPYKKEYKQQKSRGEHADRMERQRARRKMDKKGVNRKGKDIAHKKALSRGGSNKRFWIYWRSRRKHCKCGYRKCDD